MFRRFLNFIMDNPRPAHWVESAFLTGCLIFGIVIAYLAWGKEIAKAIWGF